MSLDLYEGFGFSVTRFHGGRVRGICYQIETVEAWGSPAPLRGGQLVQLTSSQVLRLVAVLQADLGQLEPEPAIDLSSFPDVRG